MPLEAVTVQVYCPGNSPSYSTPPSTTLPVRGTPFRLSSGFCASLVSISCTGCTASLYFA